MVLFDLLLFQFLGSQFLGVSCLECLNSLPCVHLTSAKFLLLISMDDGTFGYIISSFGFKVETDVGINGCFAPFWLLGTR